MEHWKSIDGYEGFYEVSNIGNVRSLDRVIKNKLPNRNCIRHQSVKGVNVKAHKSNFGYMLVDLCKNGKRKKYTVHRLVAKAFIENKNGKPCVNHINEIKSDNRVENLEWCTYLENNKYNDKHKRCSRFFEKSVVRIDVNTGERKIYKSAKTAKDQDGFNATRIARCCKGKEKRHRGFKWEYNN